MLKSTPPPPIKAPDETEPSPPPDDGAPAAPPVAEAETRDWPLPVIRRKKSKRAFPAASTNRGPSSVNAVGTPLGRYQKAVSDAIGSRWYYYMTEKRDLISIGTTANLQAEVDAQGRVQESAGRLEHCERSLRQHLLAIISGSATFLPFRRI